MKKIYILSDAKDLPTHKNCEDAIKEAGGGAVLCNLHASDEQFTDAEEAGISTRLFTMKKIQPA